MAEQTRIAAFLLDGIVPAVTTFANESSASMIGVIAAPAASLLTIYVVLWGLGIGTGHIHEPFTDGAKRIARMSLIVSLALTAGTYQSMIVQFFLSFPSQVSTALIGGSGSSTPPTIATVIDVTVGIGFGDAGRIWAMTEAAQSIAQSIGLCVLAIIVYTATIGIGAIAAGILFMAYIAISILAAIGPLFIFLALFQATQRFFEAWLGQIVNFCILFFLVAASISLSFTMFRTFLLSLSSDFADLIVDAFKIFGMSIAIVVVLLQTRSIAAALGGGVALSAQNVAGRLARGSLAAYRTMRGIDRAIRYGDSRGPGLTTRSSARLSTDALSSRLRANWRAHAARTL